MEVYLIRHTTPIIEKGICYGQADILLADSFANEADKLLKTLPAHFDAIYSSPSIRCSQLAKRIKAEQLIIDKRLLEMNFGDWEMKQWDGIDQTMLDAWMKHFVDTRVSNGESFVDLNERVNNFIDDLSQHNYKNVAIVTHGGVIRCFVAKALKKDLKDAFSIPVDYSSVTKIIFNQDNLYRVEYVNKIS